jgi:hypothetical protein
MPAWAHNLAGYVFIEEFLLEHVGALYIWTRNPFGLSYR